jgi:drug/metabolite transporter (DMT)-like permease
VYRLLTRPKLLLPFLVNQSGSVVYYYLLSSEPVSRASPICNSLTFLFTAATGYVCFGEEVRHPYLLLIGIFFILVGVCVCVMDFD